MLWVLKKTGCWAPKTYAKNYGKDKILFNFCLFKAVFIYRNQEDVKKFKLT